MYQRSPLVVHLSFPAASLVGALLAGASLVAASRVRADTPDDARVATVAGVVRDSETQQPLEGVELVLTTGRGEARVRSDAQGSYEARLAPGLLTCNVTDATEGYAAPWRVFRAPIEVTSADRTQTLPPIDLVPGRNVQGVVIDENDQPVAGAEVQAVWIVTSPWLDLSAGGHRQAATFSDAKGEFRLSGIRPMTQIRGFTLSWLMASIDGAATGVRPEPVEPKTNELLKLRVEPGAVSISGRAVDSTGRPVANADVEIWWRSRGLPPFSAPLASGQQELKTDADGRFRTARRFSKDTEYAFHVRAVGFMPGASPYASAGGEAGLTLPDVSLTRLRAIQGRVVDRQKRPVAGVRVFQSGDGPARTEATTEPDGRFVVDDVVDGPAFLFAEKSGHRFQGQLVGPGRHNVELSIRRADEPPEPLPPLPEAMPREEELEVACRAYRPLLDEGFADRDVLERLKILKDWSGLNPAAALETLDQGALADAGEEIRDSVKFDIARAFLDSSPDDAVAVAESIKATSSRANAFIVLADKLPASQRMVKLELLEKAITFGRASEKPEMRALWLECVADGLLDLGENQRAIALLDEAGKLAASLPKVGAGSFARSYVAEVLARVDLEDALALADGMAEIPPYGDVHRHIAYRVAGRLPADAERVLELCPDSFQREAFIPRICHRMAPVDADRARALVERVCSPYLRAHALGLMAMALAASDAGQSRNLLAEAFDTLIHISDHGEERLSHLWMSAAVEAALLLRAVESVDAELVPEYFWRAISLRMQIPRDEDSTTLGAVLAQYHPTLARAIAEPIVERSVRGDLKGSPMVRDALNAACVIDPRWAVETIERLPTEPVAGANSVRENALRWLAWALRAQPGNRMGAVLGDYFTNDVHWPGSADNYYLRLRY
jgi:hypothetical protein